MKLVTVKELAQHLNLSESRMRVLLTHEEAPTPVVEARNIYKGRLPGKYDLDEVIEFRQRTYYNRDKRDRW